MHDIIFCSLPFSNLDHIYPGPAVLKGVAIQNGYSAHTVDFGGTLFEQCNYDVDLFYTVQNYFLMSDDIADSTHQKIIDAWFDSIVRFFEKNPSKFIGISTLSLYTQKAVFIVCERLRAAKIPAKIVVGGRGVLPPIYSILDKRFKITGREKLLKFGELLGKRNLIDEVVYGDGEDAIVEILKGNTNVISNQISDTFYYPVSDFSDYNFKHYVFQDGHFQLPVTGSKGCVRNCDFCDIAHHFGRYRYRSGKDVANEMIQLSKKYNTRNFKFTDNLVNGGYKPFMEFLNLLSDYNLNNPADRITWTGQYICRNADEIPKGLYKLIRDSGGEGLTIGAESGSNHVLESMNKKSTVEALYSELENFRKYGITCVILTFVGHWSEEYEHFVEHCEMLLKITPYVRSGTISAIFLGAPFMMLDGTPINSNSSIIKESFNSDLVWHYPSNPNNTVKERFYRRLIVQNIAERLKIPMIANLVSLRHMVNTLSEHLDEINQFYKKLELVSNSQAKDTYLNFDNFLNKLICNVEDTLYIELEVTASDDNPNLTIKLDDQVLFLESLQPGSQKIIVQHKVQSSAELKISMSGKSESDTKVNDQGEILSDKYIIIDKFIINNFDLNIDYDLFNANFKYTNSLTPKMGFWGNETLSVNITMPFIIWYNDKSTKNVDVSDPIKLQALDSSNEKQKLLDLLNRIL